MKNIQKSTMENFMTGASNLGLAFQKSTPKDSGLEKARDQNHIDRRLSLSARSEQTHQCAIWNPHGTATQNRWEGP